MAQPVPPQGAQQQHTERPLKVYAERYVAGAPLPIGVVVLPGDPPNTAEAPRVLLPAGWVVVALGDWIISNRYTGGPTAVLGPEEFAERFGGGPAE